MPEPVIFKDLPATFPEKDKYKKPSVIGSIVFHGLLIFVVIIVPLLMPQTIPERELIVTLVSPIGPPPPPPPPPVEIPVVTVPKTVQAQVRSVAPDALIAPVTIPKEVAKIIDEPVVPQIGEDAPIAWPVRHGDADAKRRGQGGVAVGSALRGERLIAGRRDGVLTMWREPV